MRATDRPTRSSGMHWSSHSARSGPERKEEDDMPDSHDTPLPRFRIEPLDTANHAAFRAFCAAHLAHLDDSYLAPSELDTLPSPEHPTFLAFDGTRVIGAASLVLDDYHLRGHRGRFRILYVESPDPDLYALLLDAVRPAPGLIDHWFLFVPGGADDLMRSALQAGFRVSRTSRVLVRPPAPVPDAPLPPGVEIRPYVVGQDEVVYTAIRNAAFASLLGGEIPRTPEETAEQVRSAGEDFVGIFLLSEDRLPVGVVCGMRDASDESEGPMLEIGPLAVLPGHQGHGYGTLLLRHAVRDGAERAGLPKAVLSVNAENAPALGLYLREGFRVVQELSCLRQEL